jgi:tight adherence protein C
MIAISQIPLIVSALAFLVFILLFSGIFQILRAHEKKQALRARVNAGDIVWEPTVSDPSSSPERKRLVGRFVQFLGSIGKRAEGEEFKDYSHARAKFLRAGIQKPSAPEVFWGAKIFLAALFPMLFLSIRLSALGIIEPRLTLGILLGCGLLGFYLPDTWLAARTSARRKRLLDALPDALDLLVVCVEAGMGLDAAVNRVGDELKLTHKDLSDEFKLLNLELRAGKPRQAALRNLALRTALDEVNSLVTLLIQTDRFGTSVAKALRVYSDSFRTKRYQRAEEIAAKLPVKLVFPLILFIFPSLFVVILGPAAIRIYESILSR